MPLRPLVPSAQPSPDPDGTNYDFRQYNDFIDEVCDNLAANPDELNGLWSNVTFHCLMQDPENAADIAEYNVCKTKAAEIGRRIYPAFRLLIYPTIPTGSLAQTCEPSYWEAMIPRLETVAALRAIDDPRIGLDAESYLPDSLEPAQSSLESVGKTEAEFRAAFLPFAQACARLGVFPCVYPVTFVSETVQPTINKVLMEALGEDRVEHWWERTFGTGGTCRRRYLTDYQDTVRGNLAFQATWDRVFGARCLHRSVIDASSVWCNAGKPLRDVVDDLGGRKPWVYDDVRGTYPASGGVDARRKYGLPTFRSAAVLYTVNDWDYWWEFHPNRNSPNMTSVGTAATPLAATQWRASSQSSMSLGPACVKDLAGWKLVPGSQAGFETDIYGVFRIACLPATDNWSVHVEFRIPSTLAATKPLLSQSLTNAGNWQFYYDNSANAVKYQGSNGYSATILATPARDTTIKLTFARNGATAWKARVNGGTVVDLSPGGTLASLAELVVGGGEEVATFHTSNKIESCSGFVLERLGVVSRTLTDQEMLDIYNQGYPAGVP